MIGDIITVHLQMMTWFFTALVYPWTLNPLCSVHVTELNSECVECAECLKCYKSLPGVLYEIWRLFKPETGTLTCKHIHIIKSFGKKCQAAVEPGGLTQAPNRALSQSHMCGESSFHCHCSTPPQPQALTP